MVITLGVVLSTLYLEERIHDCVLHFVMVTHKNTKFNPVKNTLPMTVVCGSEPS